MLSRFRYGAISCSLAAAPILIQFVLFGIFDSYFAGKSLTTQRWLGVALLVLPPVAGLFVGLIGLLWKDKNKVSSLIGVILNPIVASFYILLLLLAG